MHILHMNSLDKKNICIIMTYVLINLVSFERVLLLFDDDGLRVFVLDVG